MQQRFNHLPRHCQPVWVILSVLDMAAESHVSRGVPPCAGLSEEGGAGLPARLHQQRPGAARREPAAAGAGLLPEGAGAAHVWQSRPAPVPLLRRPRAQPCVQGDRSSSRLHQNACPALRTAVNASNMHGPYSCQSAGFGCGCSWMYASAIHHGVCHKVSLICLYMPVK